MHSPVSTRALGECNAIRCRGFGESELTFALSLNIDFSALPTYPFVDTFPFSDGSYCG